MVRKVREERKRNSQRECFLFGWRRVISPEMRRGSAWQSPSTGSSVISLLVQGRAGVLLAVVVSAVVFYHAMGPVGRWWPCLPRGLLSVLLPHTQLGQHGDALSTIPDNYLTIFFGSVSLAPAPLMLATIYAWMLIRLSLSSSSLSSSSSSSPPGHGQWQVSAPL